MDIFNRVCGENAITYQNFLIVRTKKRNAAYSMNDAIFTDEKGKADKKLPRWQVIWDLLPHVCTWMQLKKISKHLEAIIAKCCKEYDYVWGHIYTHTKKITNNYIKEMLYYWETLLAQKMVLVEASQVDEKTGIASMLVKGYQG